MAHMISSRDDFDKQLQAAGEKLIVIDFYASWCGPCKVIAPKFNTIATATPNVVFLKVDVDELEEIAEEYNIEVMPTFVFLKQGKKLANFSGANEGRIKSLVEQHQ